eukprot:TRINITY_DN12613_c1_g1_i3.p1 TRINITY_DN12613_c1_g1~~TRINITY_DN12613_c1_g1_i3.p1  ORF type:complete len:208 (-),score=25.62 TRINITY_DN12613_c1_g1_i3:56-679(-)
MPKCGTTSLHEAFTAAGFCSVHWALDAGVDLRADAALRKRGTRADARLIGKLMQRAVSEGALPLARLPPEVNAVAEMNCLFWSDFQSKKVDAIFPQISYLEELVYAYPDAFFILNTRDRKAWVKSVDNHNDMRQRLIYADLPGLPYGVGADDEDLIAWVAGHHRRVQEVLARRHARLLCFDIDRHGEDELSSFFGRPMTWPHLNATK